MNLNRNSNVGSGKAKHTEFARLTSLFRKLDNQMNEEQKKEKVRLRVEKRENDDEAI